MGICLIVKSGGGIDTSSATVTADKILSGYTIYSNDNKITGTMNSIGAQTTSGLNAGGSTTIKAGWHDGNGAVTTNSLSSQTSADIPDTSWCLSGYSYWKNGSKSTGTMTNRGTKTWSIGANGSQTIETGWHNGSGTVKQSINVDTGEWGPNPTTTNQQLCCQGWYYSKNRWCWGNGNLTAGNIKKDITIFGVKGTYYETKRYIIQNGSLCSGISIPYYLWSKNPYGEDGGNHEWVLKQTPLSYYNETINGLNYIRLYTYASNAYWDKTETTVIRGVIGSIANLSSNDTNGKLPGAICGDFAHRYTFQPTINIRIVLHPGTSNSDHMTSIIWRLNSNSQNSTNVWKTFTYIQTVNGFRVFKGGGIGFCVWTPKLQYGDFLLDSYGRSGTNSLPELACRNLWIDTSKPI